jgi:CRISPR-associated RAMP protein (TIGR02581 family)
MQDMTTLHNRYRATGVITSTSGMRIGAGRSASLLGSDLPIVRDAHGQPYIPGSSLKGVFRTQAEQIINAFQRGHTDPKSVMEQVDTSIRKRPEFERLKNDEVQRFAYIVEHTNEIVKLFGSTLIAGRIFFRDAMLIPNSFSFIETRNGVQINRDTGTQSGSALYDYDTVPAGVSFSFELVMENVTDIQLGLVLLILDSWKANGFQIGGFTRRGLGWMSISEYKESFHIISTPKDLIDLLQGKPTQIDDNQRSRYVTALSEYLTASAGA